MNERINANMKDSTQILSAKVTMHCEKGHLIGYVPRQVAVKMVDAGHAYVLTSEDCVEYTCKGHHFA